MGGWVCISGDFGGKGEEQREESGGGDISGETVDKRWRLARAYLVRGVVPPRFIC